MNPIGRKLDTSCGDQYQLYQLWGKMVEETSAQTFFSVFRAVRGGRPKNLQSMFHHFGLSHDTGHVDCSVSPGTFSLAGCYDVNMGKSSTCQGGSKLPNRNPTHQPSTHTTSEWLLHPTPLNLQEMSKLGNLEPQSAEFNVGMPKLEGYNLETLWESNMARTCKKQIHRGEMMCT